MRYVKDSPFEVGHRVWQLRPPQPSLTFVVKGTFEPGEPGLMRIAPAQTPLTGEAYWDGDTERSLKTPDDYALRKPKGECFVIGRAWAPGGVPTPATECQFQIGSVEKSFSVFGDRVWRSALQGSLSPTVPFTSMPLAMDFAYGGAGHADNPWGRGRDEADGVIPLPNLERRGAFVTSPSSAPDPVVVGPLPKTWPARQRFAGTYDGAYLQTRWPWLPTDFDWRFFMAAPADQQLPGGYWRGDEPLRLKNLHPRLPSIRARLPGLVPRLLIHRTSGDESARRFEEVGLVLDTVVWDGELGKLMLTWRGSVEVASEGLEELELVYLAHDPLAGPHRSRAELEAACRAQLAEEEAEEEEAEGEPPPAEPAEVTAEHSIDFDPEPTPEDLEFQRGLEEQQQRLRQAQASPEHANQPSLEAPSPLEALAFMRASGIEVPDGMEQRVGAALDDAEAEEEAAPPNPPEAPRPLEGREMLLAKIQDGEPLTDLDLSDADLSDFDLSGHDLSGSLFPRADLSRIKLVGSTLVNCNLREAALFRADLSGAMLDGADLTGARLKWADLKGASLCDATLEEAILNEARLVECTAERTTFARAQLVEAVLSGGNFAEAEFDDATLDRADLRGAQLVDASLEGASAKGTCFEHSVMTRVRAEEIDARGALFGSIDAEDSVWIAATLSRVSFAFAQLTRANFSDSVLIGATLDGCSARRARFVRANAHSLRARKADLMEACFEAADLTYAQLGGTNLYGAEFWRAKTDDVWLELADLTRTKLEPK